MRYAYIYGGAIGDTLFGIHLGRILSQSESGAQLTLISTRSNPAVKDLVCNLPFISYRVITRRNPFSWIALLPFFFSKTAVALIEPTDVPISRWWENILRTCTHTSGSLEVHGQVTGHERRVKSRVSVVPITAQDNLFTAVAPRIISAWGHSPRVTVPTLEHQVCEGIPTPFILFHFFAGNYRRSFPLEKVRPLLMQAREEFPQFQFVLSAAPLEKIRALRMVEGISNTKVEANLSMHDMICLMQNAALTVGVASGITHIAAHLDVPLITLSNRSDLYWLPSYNPHVVQLSDTEHCRCEGNKVGDCTEHTPTGDVFRCLYYISIPSIIEHMKLNLSPSP